MTYVIVEDSYPGPGPFEFEKFVGEYRALLVHLCGFDNEQVVLEDVDGYPTGTVSDVSDSELEQWFNDGNGDGQAYKAVYCLEEDRKVLG